MPTDDMTVLRAKALRVKVEMHTPHGQGSDSLCIFGDALDAVKTIKYLVDGLIGSRHDRALAFTSTVVRFDEMAALEYEVLCLDCMTRVRPYAFARHMNVRHHVRLANQTKETNANDYDGA